MRVLAVSAHPDDETLGCGGTLLKHGTAGDPIDWLIATRPGEERFDVSFIARRRTQIKQVSEAYGFREVHQLAFEAAELDVVPLGAVIDAVAGAMRAARPERVYVVHPDDVHSDHRVTFEAVWAALKPFAAGRAVEVFCYETASSTDMAPPLPGRGFVANAYSDISGVMDRKLEIFSLYDTEMQEPPAPRSRAAVEALARHRGASVQMMYAEAFMVMRALL